MIDAMLWCHLASILHHSGAKLIVSCDQLLNVQCPSMWGKAFLREKCGHRLRLEACRRSDPRLFRFYTTLANSPVTSYEDLQVWARCAREQFPPIDGPPPTNLV